MTSIDFNSQSTPFVAPLTTPQPQTKASWSGYFRVAAIATSLGLHGFAVFALERSPDFTDAPIEGLELSLAPPEGDTLVEEKEAVDSEAQQEVAAAEKMTAPPPPTPPDAVEAPKVVDEEAEVLAAAAPVAEPPPIELPKEQLETDATPVNKLEQQQQAAVAVNAAEESFANRAVGVENGLKKGGGVTKAAYAAAVSKQIAKNKKRPQGQGTGAVTVSFLIGATGKADRITILRAVNPALDDTARQIIASIHLPPPPGGAFLGKIAIKFE